MPIAYEAPRGEAMALSSLRRGAVPGGPTSGRDSVGVGRDLAAAALRLSIVPCVAGNVPRGSSPLPPLLSGTDIFPRFPPIPPVFPHFPHFPHFSVAQEKIWRLRVGRLPRPGLWHQTRQATGAS